MIVYINGNDNRCKQLAKLMIADGYQIQEDSRLISSCDIIYLVTSLIESFVFKAVPPNFKTLIIFYTLKNGLELIIINCIDYCLNYKSLIK